VPALVDVRAAVGHVRVALVPGGAVADVPGAVAGLEADAVRAPARVRVADVPRRGGAARGVPDGPVHDDGHDEVAGAVEVRPGEPEPHRVHHERVGAGGGVGQERRFLVSSPAAAPAAEAAEVGAVGVEPERDVALAAAVVAAARPRQRAVRRPAHGHAPRDVVPVAVVEVGDAGAADGHELALHRREEERAAVERHGLLPEADDAAVGVARAVVARAAGVEEHGGLGRRQRDGGDLVAVAGHGEPRRVSAADAGAGVVALEPEAPRGRAAVAARADAERVGDGHVAALLPASPRRRLLRRRRWRWQKHRCQCQPW